MVEKLSYWCMCVRQCYGRISDFLDELAAYKFWQISKYVVMRTGHFNPISIRGGIFCPTSFEISAH